MECPGSEEVRMLARLVCMAFAAAAPLAHAATYTVTSTASGGSCTANATTDADCTLDAAIRAAADGDVVRFSASVQTQTILISDAFPSPLAASLTIDGSPLGVVLDGRESFDMFVVPSGVSLTLSHLTLQNGVGQFSGGAVYNGGGTVAIDSCTFTGNSAIQFGGAIANASGGMTITNSTIAGNTAADGGGIYSGGTLTVANSTIADNYATGNGGGIANDGTLSLSSDIVATNRSPNAPDVYNFSSFVSLGFNLFGDGSLVFPTQASDQAGSAAAPLDPGFATGSLAANGGATPTLALRADSPARSAGNCAGAPAVVLDQRGYPRGTPCTAGAFDLNAIFVSDFGR